MNEHYPAPNKLDGVSYDATAIGTRIFLIVNRGHSDAALSDMLDAIPDEYPVFALETGAAWPAGIPPASKDVVLVDIDALPEPFEQSILNLLEDCPDTNIMVFGEELNDDQLYRIVRAGARGYVNGRVDADRVKPALKNVISGNTWIERHIMERFIPPQSEADEVLVSRFNEKIEKLCDNLTKRETEILCEVVKGFAIKEIAEEVHLSHQGVKMHLAKLFKKFKVTNRNQLILAAFDEISPVDNMSSLLRNSLKKKLRQSNA
jgi:DNA-binding NarL/FixJ family response regulator